MGSVSETLAFMLIRRKLSKCIASEDHVTRSEHFQIGLVRSLFSEIKINLTLLFFWWRQLVRPLREWLFSSSKVKSEEVSGEDKLAISLTGLTKVAKQYFLYPAKKLLLYLG